MNRTNTKPTTTFKDCSSVYAYHCA